MTSSLSYSYIPCSERIHVAVTEMAALFHKVSHFLLDPFQSVSQNGFLTLYCLCEEQGAGIRPRTLCILGKLSPIELDGSPSSFSYIL